MLKNKNHVSFIGTQKQGAEKRDMFSVSEVKISKYGFGKCVAVVIFSNESLPNFDIIN